MKGEIYNNEILAGYLEKEVSGMYVFTYNDAYFENKDLPPISLMLLKNKKQHQSEYLFSFFVGLLSEGANKEIQCRLLKIDEQDDFTRLLNTAGDDTIGAITVKKLSNDM